MLIETLRESLAVLAASAEEQIAWLSRGQMPVDELALQFDDVLEATLRKHPFPLELANTLRNLDTALGTMSGQKNAQLWREDSLRSDERWQIVRSIARSALDHPGWPRSAA